MLQLKLGKWKKAIWSETGYSEVLTTLLPFSAFGVKS